MFNDEYGADFTDYAELERPKLQRQAFLLCRDWYEADDLVRDTLSIMFSRWPRLAHRTELHRYAHTVLVHRFMAVHRRLRWRCEILSADPPDRPQDQRDLGDLGMTLLSCLRKLPPRQRAIILLRFWGDFSIEQTAATL